MLPNYFNANRWNPLYTDEMGKFAELRTHFCKMSRDDRCCQCVGGHARDERERGSKQWPGGRWPTFLYMTAIARKCAIQGLFTLLYFMRVDDRCQGGFW